MVSSIIPHTETSARERSEEKAGYGKCDSQQTKWLRTISWRKETVHDVYIPVSQHNRCSKLLNGTHHYDGSFLWNLLYTNSFQTCTRRTSRPVRGEIMCYDSNVILSSDKNCCIIVSLTNYEKERSKTILKHGNNQATDSFDLRI